MPISPWRAVCGFPAVLAFVVTPLTLFASADVPSPPPSTLGIATSDAAVPFLLENGLLYVAGNVNGSPPLSFVVDTGATTTSLDPAVAQAADIAAGSKAPLLAAKRIFPEQVFALASTAYITAMSGHATAGVLGQPQFSRYSLALDFDRSRAALLSPDICPSAAARLPIVTAGGLPFVEASIPLPDGQQATGLFLIDTGQPGPGIVLAAGFVAAHPALLAGPRLEQPAAGKSPATTLVRLPELRLGSLRLHAPIAAVGTGNGNTDNARLAGVLGLEALRRFNLIVNRRYGALFLEPNRHTGDAFEADMSGLLLDTTADGKLVVAAVTPGSPAAAAHVQAGDVLVRMEDKTIAAANLGSVVAALRSAPGETAHAAFERNGKRLRTTLRLKRML